MAEKKKSSKKQKSKMTPLQMKNLLKNAKLRECSVNLNRLTISNSVEYREALFAKCKIRDCKVRLLCLSKEVIQEALRGKKCLAKPKQRSVRSTVSWIPTVQNHSAEMLSTFDAYRKQNSILPKNSKNESIPKSKIEPAKRQRAESMIIDQSDKSTNTPNNVHLTMDDLHDEFFRKYSTPNHGLSPRGIRQLPEPQPKPICMWKKLYDEFQAKREARLAKNIQ